MITFFKMEKRAKILTQKIMVLNAQDLFIFMDKHDGSSIENLNEQKWQLITASLFANKSKEKCLRLALSIKESNADIVMMTEVAGKESLTNFSHYFLDNEYEAFSLPSNSDRGIDLGYLVKRSLNYSLKLKSYIDHPLDATGIRFSRDVLQLEVSQGSELRFILLLVHIKSKLDLKRKDFEGRTRRTLEVKALLDIYEGLLSLGVPVLIGGDFNGHAGEKETEEEFKSLYERTDLKDVAMLAGIPDEDRFSYIYFTRGGNRFVQQIDYLFISEKYAHLIEKEECYFPRYKTETGAPLPIPKSYEQKNTLPSDHYPFLGTFHL